MNKILITGANGQLGTELQTALLKQNNITFVPTDKDELDITNVEEVMHFVKNGGFTHIVNCAAFTAVDAAESNKELCMALNANAVENLASAAKKNNCKFLHISTDYVFDGTNCRPYREDDATCPVSTYGTTKLAGERKAIEILPDCIIIRTAWLYSPYGGNFVKTMLRLGREKDTLNVVCDQVGTPTCAADLAQTIVTILTGNNWQGGIYHYSNEGAISWYDFTKAIHRIAGITTCNVKPIRGSQYPTPAARPNYSVLDKSKIKNVFGIEIPYWEESLAETINILNNKQ